MVDKIINNIKLPNGEVYAIGGGGRFGLKGDYSTHYGIEYCQHGLIDNPVGTTNIIVKGGMMLCLPGADTKTTIGSDITYSIESTSDVTIFYADGNILEAGEVHYSLNEPADNGVENYMAWWNPDFGKWQFKSNDTGNVWREAIATPIANIRIEEGNIVRIDYIGYRVLNDNIYGLKSETADIDLSNLTQDGLDVIRRNSAGANMFDTKLLDHILTYEQSKGWALQGTYVYKEAVAGSRYGYPDFYNKCVEEKDLGTPTETVLGENTITLYTNANGHTFYDIADKEAIDAWYSTYGIAWYYGIDKENERIFLPRTKWFIQPSGEITEVNSVNEAGLPNITGKLEAWAHILKSGSGAFSWYKTGTQMPGQTASSGNGGSTNFDASRSNQIYGNSDTVQPPSINQLLYICVGNTNVESAVTDVVDVTTTENDTMPLFTGMYFDFTPNNVSWLKAGEQANSGGVYTFTYNELVNILNGVTKYGDLKVINVADMEVGVDYSEYWKVNQEDMYFITPTAISNKALSGGVKGNGMTLGYTDGAKNLGLIAGVSSGATSLKVSEAGYGELLGSASGTTQLTENQLLGITTDSTKSGIVAEEATSQLYFKVANAVQNLELLDAGEVLEVLSTKTDKLQACEASFPSGRYLDLTLGASYSTYTAPANGWAVLSAKLTVGKHITIFNVNTQVGTTASFYSNSGSILGVINTPCKKGETFQVVHNTPTENIVFRFVYAEGEV